MKAFPSTKNIVLKIHIYLMTFLRIKKSNVFYFMKIMYRNKVKRNANRKKNFLTSFVKCHLQIFYALLIIHEAMFDFFFFFFFFLPVLIFRFFFFFFFFFW